MPIPVLLVDDHTLVRDAIARMLGAHPNMEVIGQAGSLAEGKELLVQTGVIAGKHPGAVLVVDVSMGDGSGLSLVRTVREVSRTVGIVVLTMHDDDSTLMEAVQSGASALVRKSEPSEEVVAAVLHASTSPLSFTATGLADALRRGATAKPANPLTPREQEVLAQLAAGASVNAAAKALFMSPSTVKTHVAKIYDKLGANNRASAVMAALRMGIIDKE